MKNIKEIMEEANVSRATVYYRLGRVEEIIGKTEIEYRDGKTNDDRILSDEVAKMIVDYRGKKPGRKTKMKNSSLNGIAKEDIDEVVR